MLPLTDKTERGYSLYALMNRNLLVGVVYHFHTCLLSFIICLSRPLVSSLILHILISILSEGKDGKIVLLVSITVTNDNFTP